MNSRVTNSFWTSTANLVLSVKKQSRGLPDSTSIPGSLILYRPLARPREEGVKWETLVTRLPRTIHSMNFKTRLLLFTIISSRVPKFFYETKTFDFLFYFIINVASFLYIKHCFKMSFTWKKSFAIYKHLPGVDCKWSVMYKKDGFN